MSAPAPIFILAAPFCGTSYLAGQLGCHPSLYALPELGLCMADTVGELLDIFRLSQGPQADGLLRAVAELEFAAQDDAGIAQARQWLQQRRALRIDQLLALFADRVAPRRLVVPDSETPLRPIDLRRLQRHFPQAQIVHLVRHPWEQGCLLSAWARQRLFIPPDFKDHGWVPQVVDPQIPWLRCNRNIEAAFGDAAVRVRSEDLEQAPHLTLAGLCAVLGLASGTAVMAPMLAPEQWPFAGHGPAAAPYGLEAEVLEPFDEADLALAATTTLTEPLPWRPDGTAFVPEVVADAQRYGYS